MEIQLKKIENNILKNCNLQNVDFEKFLKYTIIFLKLNVYVKIKRVKNQKYKDPLLKRQLKKKIMKKNNEIIRDN